MEHATEELKKNGKFKLAKQKFFAKAAESGSALSQAQNESACLREKKLNRGVFGEGPPRRGEEEGGRRRGAADGPTTGRMSWETGRRTMRSPRGSSGARLGVLGAVLGLGLCGGCLFVFFFGSFFTTAWAVSIDC